MKHLDLFSGIGGFALAAWTVWGDEYENIGFCEIDRYCQELLKKRFPGSVIYNDIKELTAERVIRDTKSKRHTEVKSVSQGEAADAKRTDRGTEQWHIDLLTGGFPCQPFSQAGKRKGTDDDRHLWPQMLRIIKETRPNWIIGENVAGILSMAQPGGNSKLESETDFNEQDDGDSGANGIVWGIINDLTKNGYDIQPFIIPAAAVGAPHRRDRVWFIANARREHGQRQAEPGKYEITNTAKNAVEFERPVGRNSPGVTTDTDNTGKRTPERGTNENRTPQSKERGRQSCAQFNGQNTNATDTATDTAKQGGERGGAGEQGEQAQQKEKLPGRYNPRNINNKINRDPDGVGLQGLREKQKRPGPFGLPSRETQWREKWFKIATEFCGVDDGLSAELDGLKFSKSAHRNQRLKALGNAIVPQVAVEIMKAIKKIETGARQ